MFRQRLLERGGVVETQRGSFSLFPQRLQKRKYDVKNYLTGGLTMETTSQKTIRGTWPLKTTQFLHPQNSLSAFAVGFWDHYQCRYTDFTLFADDTIYSRLSPVPFLLQTFLFPCFWYKLIRVPSVQKILFCTFRPSFCKSSSRHRRTRDF